MFGSPLQTTSAARYRQARAWVYTGRIGDRNKLSPSSAGAMCCSPPQTTTSTAQHDKGATKPDWASHVAKQVERHHFYAYFSLRGIHFKISTFQHFRFSTPGRAIYQHRLISLISGPQSSLTMVDQKHRSLFRHGSLTSLSLHRYRSFLDLRRRKAWHLHVTCKHGHMRWSRMGRGQWTF